MGEDDGEKAADVSQSGLLLVLPGSSPTACIVLLVVVTETLSKPEPHSSLWQNIGVAMDTQAKMKGIKHILIWNERERERERDECTKDSSFILN